jgi:hypothetical protein
MKYLVESRGSNVWMASEGAGSVSTGGRQTLGQMIQAPQGTEKTENRIEASSCSVLSVLSMAIVLALLVSIHGVFHLGIQE